MRQIDYKVYNFVRMLEKQEIKAILDRMPETIPVGDDLLSLSLTDPIGLAVKEIIHAKKGWMKTEIKRMPLLVTEDQVRSVVEALAAGPYRSEIGSRIIEFMMDPVFADEYPDIIPPGMMLHVEDGTSLWVANAELLKGVSWINTDYHQFMNWVD